jgi:uncharacterized membrane protein YkoI
MNTFDKIDGKRAEDIAREFLRQHHSVSDLVCILEDGVWLVQAKTRSFGDSVKQVRIDAKTGTIISVV